jgi:uncharacterized protein with GYD domain
MALYALQASYTPIALTALVDAPANRLDTLRPVVERLGGRIVGGWLCFGDYDSLVICELPDAVSAAALSMAISSSGAIRAAKTTPLITFDEGVAALKKAAAAGYAAPPTEIPYFGTYRKTA